MPSRRTPPPFELGGSLWITAGGQSLGGHGRVALLRAVSEHGSITQAARAFGMSYKAAWDAIDAMNALAGQPLVTRATGGRGGGSTRLTEHGERLVARYEQLDALHQRFVRHLACQAMDLEREISLLEVLNVKTSARNQWLGTVRAVRTGAVNDEVEVALPGGEGLRAVITHESARALGVQANTPVIVLVKAPAVVLATGLEGARLSAGNRLEGRVRQLQQGAVNAEVTLETASGLQVVAIVTQHALAELSLEVDAPVTALVKESDVVLAVVT